MPRYNNAKPRPSGLPSLKLWRHDHETDNFEHYTIALTPTGQLVQYRAKPRAVPAKEDVIYTLIRWRDRWYVEYATASQTVHIDAAGEEFAHGNMLVGRDRVFSSAMKARSAANKHWLSHR